MSQQLIEAILASPLDAVADYYAQCLAGNERAIAFVRDELKWSTLRWPPKPAPPQRLGSIGTPPGGRLERLGSLTRG